jgi:hypothetical protein
MVQFNTAVKALAARSQARNAGVSKSLGEPVSG